MNEINEHLTTLGGIAKQYADDSPEETAIRCAAFALLFVLETNQLGAYNDFVSEANRPLDSEQKDFLSRQGLSEE